MSRNYLYVSDSFSGNDNLALDEFFLDNVGEDDLILYFYINQNAVIIGKNQNPRKECNLEKMKADGVELVRRVSGGGAVYHDRGNLNYSFIAGKNRYDKDQQHRFILETVSSLGIPCEFSGRNDLLAFGKKFSGNAYCSRGIGRQHHGTLLVSSDLSRLSNYLTVDPRKIRSKGVSSVSSRVCNLSDINPEVTVEKLLSVIPENFMKTYGDYEKVKFSDFERSSIEKYIEKHRSDDWIFEKTPEFNEEIDCRLSFGGVQILMWVKNWQITSCKTYTDANDDTLGEKIDAALISCRFDKESVSSAIKAIGSDECSELAEYVLSENSLF